MQRIVLRWAAVIALASLAIMATSGTARAQPADAAAASAFGATITGGGEDIVPPTPNVSVALGEDASETLIDVPADPLAVSGTLIASASAHADPDIETALTVNEQAVAGPYNAAGVGVVEHLEVLVNQVDAETSLLTATVLRAEAAAVCSGGTASYTANSEIVDLQIAGEPVPLNGPAEQLIDGVNRILAESGLNQVVDIQRNVVTENPDGGIGVDALVVTLLAAAGDQPLAQVRLAHAEVGPLSCGAPIEVVADPPEELPALPRTGADGGALAAVGLALASGAVGLTWLRHRLRA